jgi:cytoskeleton protein RodZ
MNIGRDDDASDNVAGNGRASIGSRLSAAREKHKLTANAVADELKLDVNMIYALENDDKAALPSAIFVQGYLRRYARLVGLPEDELVRDYSEITDEPPPLTVVAIRRKTPFFRLPSGRVLRNIILVLLALIMLWLAWPFVERLVASRGQPGEEEAPGHLELPPANKLILPQQPDR